MLSHQLFPKRLGGGGVHDGVTANSLSFLVCKILAWKKLLELQWGFCHNIHNLIQLFCFLLLQKGGGGGWLATQNPPLLLHFIHFRKRKRTAVTPNVTRMRSLTVLTGVGRFRGVLNLELSSEVIFSVFETSSMHKCICNPQNVLTRTHLVIWRDFSASSAILAVFRWTNGYER